jgi:hypothetical protein
VVWELSQKLKKKKEEDKGVCVCVYICVGERGRGRKHHVCEVEQHLIEERDTCTKNCSYIFLFSFWGFPCISAGGCREIQNGPWACLVSLSLYPSLFSILSHLLFLFLFLFSYRGRRIVSFIERKTLQYFP